MKLNKLRTLFALTLLCASNIALAQTKDLAKEDVIFKELTEEVEVFLKNGEPHSKSHIHKVIQYQTEKALNMVRSHTVYFTSFEEISNLTATVAVPQDKGKAKTFEVRDFKESYARSRGIFYDDTKQVTFELPGLAVGAVVTIDYTIINTECHYFHSFYFNNYLPTAYAEFKVVADNDIEMDFFKRNTDKPWIKFTKEEKRKETIYKWTGSNIDDYDRYGNSPSLSYAYPHIVPKISKVKVDGNVKPFMGTVADLYKWYRKNMRNVNPVLDDSVKSLALNVTAKAKTREEKIKAIFDYTKTNIKYVAFEDGMNGIIPRNANMVLSKKYGDCKDLSCFMNQMLKAVDIESYPTWIGTRSITYTYEELPTKNSDNHMILSVPQGNDWLYLDATDPDGIFGLPTDHIQGKQALIGISNDEYKLAMVPVISSRENVVQDSFKIKIVNKDIDVAATVICKGLVANNISRDLRYMDKKEKEDFVKAYFKEGNTNLELKDFDINIVNESLLIIKSNYRLKDYVRVIGGETYFNYHINRALSSSKIDDKDRTVPVEFDRNVAYNTVYQIEIPAGKTLDYQPPNLEYNAEGFKTKFVNTASPSMLLAKQDVEINFKDLYLMADQFQKWNEMIGKMNKQYNETIIIK